MGFFLSLLCWCVIFHGKLIFISLKYFFYCLEIFFYIYLCTKMYVYNLCEKKNKTIQGKILIVKDSIMVYSSIYLFSWTFQEMIFVFCGHEIFFFFTFLSWEGKNGLSRNYFYEKWKVLILAFVQIFKKKEKNYFLHWSLFSFFKIYFFVEFLFCLKSVYLLRM